MKKEIIEIIEDFERLNTFMLNEQKESWKNKIDKLKKYILENDDE